MTYSGGNRLCSYVATALSIPSSIFSSLGCAVRLNFPSNWFKSSSFSTSLVGRLRDALGDGFPFSFSGLGLVGGSNDLCKVTRIITVRVCPGVSVVAAHWPRTAVIWQFCRG